MVYCSICHDQLLIKTVIVDGYKTEHINSFWRYEIIGVLSDEKPTMVKTELGRPAKIRKGDLISSIRHRGKNLALVNYSTGEWIDSKSEDINVLKEKYLNYLRVIILFLVVLEAISLILYIKSNPISATMALLVLAGLFAAGFLLKLGEGNLNEKLDIKRTISWLRNS